jgi:antitoxin HicB
MKNHDVVNKLGVDIRTLPDDLGGGFEAVVPRLRRGVVGRGATPLDALEDLQAALPAFMEAVEEMGLQLPDEPELQDWDDYSGKFNVRLPRMLHARLAGMAAEQGVSLNSLVQTLLAAGVTAVDVGAGIGGMHSALGALAGMDSQAAKKLGLVSSATALAAALAGPIAPAVALSGLIRTLASANRLDLYPRLVQASQNRPDVAERVHALASQAQEQVEISPAIVEQIEEVVLQAEGKNT